MTNPFDRLIFQDDPIDIQGFSLGYMSVPVLAESPQEREETAGLRGPVTRTGKPNKKGFVEQSQRRRTWDGKSSHHSHAKNTMQQIITAKLKLIAAPERFAALQQTALAYRDALNAVSHYAFEQDKTSNVTKLHRGMYTEPRTRNHLPSQLVCSVKRQVTSTYKGLWTKLKKNADHRCKQLTRKRFKGLDKPPELQALISYKAALAGSLALVVDVDYTSKACPMCGHTADENRPRKGLLFVCQNNTSE